MDEKISLEAITLYGDLYAEKIVKGFFTSKENISGSEILKLSDIHQINLFVIRELFKAWKEETRKSRSAYFDYENREVQEALNSYMTVLSNHISVGRAHFSPLLKKAVSQTLMLIFNPYDFYSIIITGRNNKLELQAFREEIKYLKINKAPLERMLERLEKKGVAEIPGNEAFAVLDQVLEEVNFAPEELDEYITKFSAVTPLDPSKFFVKVTEEKVYPTKKSEPVETVVESPQVQIKSPEKIEPVLPKKVIVEQSRSSEGMLNDNLIKSRQPAVMDHLRKISKIKESLSINQKFMFTKVLFFGDFDSFSRAVDDLDQQPNLDAALRFLDGYSATWDKESKEFHEFMEMVEMRFS
jgi:hypothetical protein